MKIIVRRFAHVPGYSDDFIEALHQLSRERGGGYIPKHEIEARAATILVVPPLLPPVIKLPPL